MPYSVGNQNPYEGGNVVFNSQPYTDYFMKVLAHNYAMNEAFQKRIQEMDKNLTPAGVDTTPDKDGNSDALDVSKAVKTWMQDAQNNKGALRRNDPSALMQNDQLYRNALDLINQSKQKLKNNLETMKFYQLHPENFDSDKQQMMSTAQLPIMHGYKPFDWNATVEPKNLDVNKYISEAQKNYPIGDTGTAILSKSNNPAYLNATTPQGNNPTQIKQMGDNSGADYLANPSFKKYIDKTVAGQIQNELNSGVNDTMKKYNDAYKSVYGTDMNLSPTNHSDLAKAWGILNLQRNVSPKVSVKTNPDYMNKLIDSRIMLRAGLQNNKEGQDAGLNSLAVMNNLRNIFQQSETNSKSSMGYKNFMGQGNLLDVNDPEILKDFKADNLYYDKDNKQFILHTNGSNIGADGKTPQNPNYAMIPAKDTPLSATDYAKLKTKQMLGTNKLSADVQNAVSKLISQYGDIEDAANNFDKPVSNTPVKTNTSPIKSKEVQGKSGKKIYIPQ